MKSRINELSAVKLAAKLTIVILSILMLLPHSSQAAQGNSSALPFTGPQFKAKVNKTINSLKLKGMPLIKEMPNSDLLGGDVVFESARRINLYMKIRYEWATQRRIEEVEMFTRHLGGEMWGETELFWVAYAVILTINPKKIKSEAQNILADLRMVNITSPKLKEALSKTVNGIEYTRLPADATHRETLVIRRAKQSFIADKAGKTSKLEKELDALMDSMVPMDSDK